MATFIIIDDKNRAWTILNASSEEEAVDKFVEFRASTPVLVCKVSLRNLAWNAAYSVENKFAVVRKLSLDAF